MYNKRFWQDMRMMMALAMPVIIEQILQTAVQYADTAMVGRLGADASAAVGLTTSVNWLVNSLLMGAGVGILASVARASGAGDEKKVQETAMQAVILALIVGTAETVIFVSVSRRLPVWLGAEPQIWEEAGRYFFIISLPVLFRAVNIIFSSALRGVKDTKTPMIVNLCVNILNIVLNFVLIYESRMMAVGNMEIKIFGAGFGVAGAAAATAISQTIGGIVMGIVFMKNRRFGLRGHKIHYKREVMRQCINIGIPVAMERSMTCLGHVVFTGLVTSLGTVPFAAHSIALTAEQAFYIPGYGLQGAVSTVVGNTIGEKDAKKLKRLSWMFIGTSFVLMLVMGTVLFIFARQMMGLFTRDTAVIAAGTTVLKIVAVSEPVFGVMIIMEGIFQGAGDTKMPFVFSLVTMWGVRICSTFVGIHYFDFSLSAVWICMVADNICRCTLMVIRFMRWKVYKMM